MLFRHEERKKRIEVYKLIPCGDVKLLTVKVGVIRSFNGENAFLPREDAKLTIDNLLDIVSYMENLKE